MNSNPLVGDGWLLAERINEKPITRPDYTRALDIPYAKWVVVNDIALMDYFVALEKHYPDGCTFIEFCRVQYEGQLDLDEDYDEYVLSGEAARDEAAEPSDEWLEDAP